MAKTKFRFLNFGFPIGPIGGLRLQMNACFSSVTPEPLDLLKWQFFSSLESYLSYTYVYYFFSHKCFKFQENGIITQNGSWGKGFEILWTQLCIKYDWIVTVKSIVNYFNKIWSRKFTVQCCILYVGIACGELTSFLMIFSFHALSANSVIAESPFSMGGELCHLNKVTSRLL